MDFQTSLQIATFGFDVLILGVGANLVRYLVSIERRITRIETKLGIEMH